MYHAVKPPSIGIIAPVIQLASSEARKSAPYAISSGLPIRPIGCSCTSCLFIASGFLDEQTTCTTASNRAYWMQLYKLFVHRIWIFGCLYKTSVHLSVNNTRTDTIDTDFIL